MVIYLKKFENLKIFFLIFHKFITILTDVLKYQNFKIHCSKTFELYLIMFFFMEMCESKYLRVVP